MHPAKTDQPGHPPSLIRAFALGSKDSQGHGGAGVVIQQLNFNLRRSHGQTENLAHNDNGPQQKCHLLVGKLWSTYF